MACNSDHMRPNHIETALSKVLSLLDEVRLGGINLNHFSGYHPHAYNCGANRKTLDDATATLCTIMQSREATDYSLELQLWWRDHQKADADKAQAALDSAKTDRERKAALNKLTPHERSLLGLD